jgi:adenine-specific DNA-methyltransferase
LSDEAKFALCDDLIPLNTVFFMTGTRIIPILAMLNAKIILWYFTHCLGTTSGVGTNRWLKYKIEQLPLPQKGLESLNQIMASFIQRRKMKQNTESLEQDIDNNVCTLYDLSAQEIEWLNKTMK